MAFKILETCNFVENKARKILHIIALFLNDSNSLVKSLLIIWTVKETFYNILKNFHYHINKYFLFSCIKSRMKFFRVKIMNFVAFTAFWNILVPSTPPKIQIASASVPRNGSQHKVTWEWPYRYPVLIWAFWGSEYIPIP